MPTPQLRASEILSMQAEANRQLFDKTCTILRNSPTQNAQGLNVDNFTAIATGVGCNIAQPSQTYLVMLATKISNQTSWQVDMAFGTDVKSGDQLNVGGSVLVVQAVNTNTLFPSSFGLLLNILASEVN
jgi:hypothetical protein